MGFYASSAVATTYSEIMHAIWTHAASGSSPVTIASEGGNSATWNGSAFATPSSSSFWNTSGSYVVLSCPRPDGGACQLKVLKTATVALEFAPHGGWQSSDGTFGAALTGGSVACFDVAPASGDTMRVSSSDLDTYGVGPYAAAGLCAWWYDASATSIPRGFYFGSLIPKNPADQRAVVLLSKLPTAANTTNGWGSTASSGNLNLGFANDGRTALSWACMTSSARVDSVAADHDGYYGAGELTVDSTASKLLGNVPPSLLRRISNTIAADSLVGAGKWRTTSTGLAMRVST